MRSTPTDGRPQASTLARSTNHKVFTGADNGVSMVMRFLRHKAVIHKGEKVRFVNNMSMGAPHTVTFGTVPAGLALFAPSGHPTNYRGGNLNSGILPPHSSFTVTFNKVGKFPLPVRPAQGHEHEGRGGGQAVAP